MRVLLDNCIPWRLAKAIAGHDVEGVFRLGWADLDDGPLLDAMAGRFDVLLTVDKSMPFQQRLAGRPIALIVMRAPSNRLIDLLPLVPSLQLALASIRQGDVVVVEAGP